jgi:Putative adhesin
MRMLGPFCFCALFVAGMWSLESLSWGSEQSSIDGLAWRNPVAAGKTLSIRNINGSITVTAASGSDAEVHAEVRYVRSNPKDIRFEVKTDDRGTTVCALWPGMEHCDAKIENGSDNDLEVAFVVRLPSGVRADVVTVNGAVDVRGATTEVNAATVNGDVMVDSRATPLRAETVNGKIDVRIADMTGDGSIRLATVNGDISAQLPPRFDVEVTARTVSGTISILGKDYQERVRTTVGRGGRKLSAQNVNGSIAIR